MFVRAWIFVGSPPNMGLPPEKFCGPQYGALPEASTFEPGDWIEWRPGPGFDVVAVCVTLPLVP